MSIQFLPYGAIGQLSILILHQLTGTVLSYMYELHGSIDEAHYSKELSHPAVDLFIHGARSLMLSLHIQPVYQRLNSDSLQHKHTFFIYS